MIVIGGLIGIVVVLIYIWYNERRKMYNTFKRIDVTGPPPDLLLGNMGQMKNGPHEAYDDWAKQYGKTYGYFEGPRPVLVTSDTKLLKHIFITDFNKFNDRKGFLLQDKNDKFVDTFVAKGHAWKRLRAISSPSFSTRRMKEMSPLLNNAITELMDCLDAKCKEGKPFDIYEYFQKMTLTAIASTAFGIEVKPLQNPDDVFLQKARKIFSFAEDKNKPFVLFYIIVPLAISFPGLFGRVWQYVRPYINHPKTWFLDMAKKILEHRMEVKSDRCDFLKLMLDAGENETSTEEDLTMTLEENEENSKGSGSPQTITYDANNRGFEKKMSMEEMQGNSTIFLLAGYETSSTALGFLSYILALRPDIQQKLVAEIDQHFPDKDCQPDYTALRNLPYMEMVIHEVLRMYPIAQIATSRVASEDCEILGQKIPKGLAIQAHIAAIHKDPGLWGPEDPEEFVPERFLPERKAKRDVMAWMPFGAGPRNCVGMRFALLEVKMTLVCVLKRFTIERCEETKIPLPLNKMAIRNPAEGVHVNLVERD